MTKISRKIDQDFFYALNAMHPNLEKIQDFINYDRSVVFSTNHEKETGLHIAAHNGNLAIVDALIKAGANVNARNTHGETAIRQAAENGHVDVVELLCKAKANPNLDIPLHEAAFRGETAIVTILCDHGANPNHLDKEKNTPLHYITAERFIGEVDDNHIKSLEVLIERGASPKQVNNTNKTPMQTLAANSQISDEMRAKAQAILDPTNYKKTRQGFLLSSQIVGALEGFGQQTHSHKPSSGHNHSSKQLWQY